ncbi:MAG: saccharopine dehydrogenase NADP-binding domain-containing protein [Fulvivirga sp.]|uniref:saccharopine dehydrogenase family protein n=1 Tax=Fulvivirga sp. TaxID=1931237 RepID=UPI0032EC992C
MKDLLIYGSYGYTGKLIVEEALTKGLKPTLAGRNENAVKRQAEETKLDYLVFDLSEEDKLNAALANHKVIIHCAGPFIHTAKQVAEACIKNKTHYLDITGEFQVFEDFKAMSAKAEAAGVMLLPGAGFDVVPSDCLANHLKAKLPTATDLILAFTGLGGGLSRGTAKTMVENSHEGQTVRKNGKLVSSSISTANINYGEFEQISLGISWGDISSAYFSTGIPNIEVFMGSHEKQIKQVKTMAWFRPLLKLRFVKNYLQKQIDKKPAGPSDEKREKGKMYLWGKVSIGNESVEARLNTPNGYTLTASTSVLIAKKILDENFKTGFQTPASAYGSGLILEVHDTKLTD